MTPDHPFHQVAYVVSDLDAAVRHWSDVLRVGPWSVWTMDSTNLHDCMIAGESVDFGIRHALASSGALQVELVQPLDGPTIFAEQIGTSGPGLNHIGMLVDDHPAASAALEADGYRPLQSARFGASEDGRFAYFAAPSGGAIIELIAPPSVRFPPDYVYPPKEG